MGFPLASVAAPTLEDFQFQYGGLTFGGFDVASSYHFLDADGIYNLATLSSGDSQRPMDQGEYAGVDVFGGRDIMASVIIRETPTQTFDAARIALSAVMKVRGSFPQPMWVKTPGGLYVSEVRPRKFDAPVDYIAVQSKSTTAHLMWHSVDPRLYGSPSKEAGRTGSGELPEVNNEGNEECRPIWIVEAGPKGTKNPKLTNKTLPGEPFLEFEMNLEPGDVLLADLDWGTAVKNPEGEFPVTSAEKKSKTSTWWSLEPGVNVLSFESTDTEARTKIVYANAFVAA